jgi:hypothetical protein
VATGTCAILENSPILIIVAHFALHVSHAQKYKPSSSLRVKTFVLGIGNWGNLEERGKDTATIQRAITIISGLSGWKGEASQAPNHSRKVYIFV